jgi:hypothetical protein
MPKQHERAVAITGTSTPPVTEPLPRAVDFIPTSDALLRHPQLAFSVELPVLGIATRFETNSRYVCDLVVEAFGGWRCLPGDAQRFSPRGLHVRIVVHDGGEGGTGHTPVRYLCPDATRVILHSPGSVAISDPVGGESVAYVTTALASDRAHFRLTVLEAITLALLSHFDRHPIHAAAIARGGRAVLLAAPSGTGKSTLAYTAHTAGFDVLGDDHVWVQLTPALRIWGWPGRVLLLPEAASIFPEVAALGATSNENGERKLAYDVDATTDVSRYFVDRAVVCILERGRANATLERLRPAALVEGLATKLTSGFDRFPERHEAVIRALAADGGWRLTLSDDPREALPLLRTMLDEE